ncbi:nucleic acid/nucleotide deaminase domain-containing protein [Aspergillus puulaauensis]|uniref:Uncharacterized protein n=1 Tax=Aspergillus puulaauensis TaxID=1220207 RepID=A0A7R7XEC0_9EURO|nr:uncharacterized protein APUU_12316A [Aspergillus puulaauensis]BCS19488.1 hypothetical protein APUU_12316A [Aspergillus puulaauensis]
MPSELNPLIISAESIALSSLVCSIPAPPSDNNTECLPSSNRKYTLPLDTERQLARTLAFLSHSKDDVNHIPAVCLEEDQDTGGLNVIFAVNRTSHKDGGAAMARIKTGFDRLFSTLANLGLLPDLKRLVLDDVICMCSGRILSRLRLAPSKRKRDSRPFRDSLREAVLAAKRISDQKLRESNMLEVLNQFAIKARDAEKLIDSWSRHQVQARLIELVEGIYQVHRIPQLPALIRAIPNRDLDPCSKESVLNIVSKVSRYRESARFLYRTAKDCALARNMRAVPVHLPREAYDIPSFNGYAPNLRSRILEASSKGQQKRLINSICSVSKLTEQQAIAQYSQQVPKTLTEGKIHAEVQLIAYCELQKPKMYPRLVCSSKDACFLCNMFLLEYHKILAPRSHGKLYPGWRLPCPPQLTELEFAFCDTLGSHLQQTLSHLLSKKQWPVHPCPNESTLFTLPSLSTPAASLSSKAGQAAEPRAQNEEGLLPSPHLSTTSINSVHSAPAAREGTDLSDGNGLPDAVVYSPRHRLLRHYTLISNSTIQGRLSLGESSTFYTAGSIHIQLEHSTGTKNMQYWLKRLDIEEVAKAQAADPPSVVLDAFQLETPVTISDRNVLYLTAKDTVLEIGWRPVASD